LQRAATRGAAARAVPPLVHEVLRTPGQPLEAAARAFFEPRFGRDFTAVRVHTDAPAAESARAVDALAYTVGQHIVFGAGRYRPGEAEGKRLLAHELAHAVQQQGAGPPDGELRVAPPDGAAEREADAAAEAVLRGRPVPPPAARAVSLARNAEPSTPQEGCVCGPNVTTQTKDAVAKIRSTFGGWTGDVKYNHCCALDSVITAGEAWDVQELHNQQWIKRYRPQCATACPGKPCGKFYPDEVKKVKDAVGTVQVESSCHYPGSVNYVAYGVMCRLCNDHFNKLAREADSWAFRVQMESAARSYSESAMLRMIWYYKGEIPLVREASGNYEASKAWARAGFNNWPSGGSGPAGDRGNCSATCPLAYGSAPLPTDGTASPGTATGPFSVHWIGDPLATSDAEKKKWWF
jgi:hypothetical protein